MKKLFAAALLIMMLSNMLIPAIGSASSLLTFTISSPGLQGQRTQEVRVPISVSGNSTGFAAVGLVVTYEAEVFEILEDESKIAAATTDLPIQFPSVSRVVEHGEVKQYLLFANILDMSNFERGADDSVVIANLTFRVRADAPLGRSTIGLNWIPAPRNGRPVGINGEFINARDPSSGIVNIVGRTPVGEPVTVTFDAAGGTPVPLKQELESGDTANRPRDPSKAGYTFAGWLLQGALYDFSMILDRSITLVADWEPDKGDTPVIPPGEPVTVKFDSAGGSAVPDQNIKSGERATRPPDPTRAGYIFSGWQLGGVSFAFDTLVNRDITLVALWAEDKGDGTNVTVAFDPDGGSAVPAQTIPSGTRATRPPNPTRAGFTFVGWLLNSVAFDFNTPVTSSITLKAQWNSAGTPTPTPGPSPTPGPGTPGNPGNPGGPGGGTVHSVLSHFSTWTGSGTSSARVDAEHSRFVRLLKDGNVVAAANYTVASGSTVITLTEDYIKTLPAGTHTFRGEWTDGVADMRLILSANFGTVPQTGVFDITGTIIMMCLSVLMTAALCVYLFSHIKKQRKDKDFLRSDGR